MKRMRAHIYALLPKQQHHSCFSFFCLLIAQNELKQSACACMFVFMCALASHLQLNNILYSIKLKNYSRCFEISSNSCETKNKQTSKK